VRALVTGGAGFVGGAVARLLADRGDDVVVVDDLRTGPRDGVPDGCELVEIAVGDRQGIGALLADREIDVCLHFAGRIEAGESMRRPETFLETNVGETMVLLEALVAAGVGRVVFSSSAAVYGDPEYTPIDEAHPTAPVSVYGQTKLMVEQALGWLARLGKLRYAALRYFNAAGALGGCRERHRPETHLIPLAIEVAAGERDALELYGADYPTSDGTCVRDYVHVGDLANAHLLALDALDGLDALVCNLGSGTGHSNIEVIQAVREVTGRPLEVRTVPRRAGDPAVLVASNDRARELLGWEPARSGLRQIVGDAWAARTAGVQR